MTALQVLTELRTHGKVELVGDNLRVRVPNGVLTQSLRAAIGIRKREIIKLLRSYPCAKCDRFAFPESETICYWCGGHP